MNGLHSRECGYGSFSSVRRWGSGGVLLLMACFLATTASAFPVTYTIDDTETTVTASGLLLGIYEFAEQVEGSLTDNLEGTIVADLAGSTLTFSGGSVMDAKDHPASTPSTPFLPLGTGEDNFAVEDPVSGALFFGTVRDAVADVFSGSMTFGESVENQAEFGFVAGGLDYDVPLISLSGRIELDTMGAVLNSSTGVLGREVVDDVETITIPVDFTFPFDLVNPNDSVMYLAGQIVASRIVLNQWKTTGMGSYNGPSNWTEGVVPNAVDAEANFLGEITGDSTAMVDDPVIVGNEHLDC